MVFMIINIFMVVVEGLGKKLDPDLDLFAFIQSRFFKVFVAVLSEYCQILTGDAFLIVKFVGDGSDDYNLAL